MRGSAAGLRANLQRLWAPVWKVLSYCPGDDLLPAYVVCIRLDRGRLDVVIARRSFLKYSVGLQKTCKYADRAYPSPEEVASAAAASISLQDMRRTKAVLIVPREWIALKSVDLPVAVEENLGDVIVYEFDRFTPFRADEALYDFHSERSADDKVNVMLAAAKNDQIKEYTEKLSQRGISVARLDFDASAVAVVFGFISGLDRYIFMEAGADGYNGGYVERGLLRKSESREFGAVEDIRRAEQIEEFIRGLKTSMVAKAPPVPVLLSFREDASQLRQAVVTRAKISFKTAADFEDRLRGLAGLKSAGLAPAGGALEYLLRGAGGFNLLSRGMRDQIKRPFMVTALLSVLMTVIFALYLFMPIQTEGDRLAEIENQINRRKPAVMDVEKIRSESALLAKKLALMDSFRHEKPSTIELTKELTLRIPKNAWLTRVRISGQQVNIEGYAPSATSMIQLLEASRYFRNVEFTSPTFRDAAMNMDRFQIKMEMRPRKAGEAGNEKQ